ncbi:Pyrophosphate--fructose 6-phosphate 1-phosphotransferase [Planctomycetales bacterium 10988]|nr:Pyrophosphate--fructose 6-phosphate 1-phosphotransferase [Planctomycetales bacterium 10988]
MKRIAIMTTGGDTPALNATVHGAVSRANAMDIEVLGLLQGYDSIFDPQLPHVKLNPLFTSIPELDPTKGGTILGASRAYVDHNDTKEIKAAVRRMQHLGVEGLVVVGGDGSLNGMQPISEYLPAVLAPKTIDNDLGLNYFSEVDEWKRVPDECPAGYRYERAYSTQEFDLEQMVNYVTAGYATAVFVSSWGVQRIRTTAESHQRIAIIEVMGRQSGYIALGASYGQPDIILIPEHPLDFDLLVERVKELYDRQRNVVIVCGEGIVDQEGRELGAGDDFDPAGNVKLVGAAYNLRHLLAKRLGDSFFTKRGIKQTAESAIFVRRVGHTQRGGRPIRFDRFLGSEVGGKAVEMLVEGQSNTVATIQWNRTDGFYLDSIYANQIRDRWGLIHPRTMHPCFYDGHGMKASRVAIDYLLNVFANAIGHDDVEHIRQTLFNSGNLFRSYHSINADIAKRTRHVEMPEGEE